MLTRYSIGDILSTRKGCSIMSMAKVAKLAGVSNTTVSFVINDKPGISPSTVSKVRAAMNKIGYVPRLHKSINGFQEESTGLRTGNIGVAMGEFVMSTVPFYARLFESLHHALDDKGLKMVPMRVKENPCIVDYSSVSDLDGVILCYYFKN